MEVTRRSSVRLRTNKAPFTPTVSTRARQAGTRKGKSSAHNVNYELDKSKAIKQKIEACNRPYSVSVKFAQGNIILTFSAAAYEEFKAVTLNFLNSQNGSIDSIQTKDAKGSVVSESISVTKDGSKLFVLNFYNTTSRLLLNGNAEYVSRFVNDYLSDILDILDRNNQFSEINILIRNYCTQYLNDQQRSSSENRTINSENMNNTGSLGKVLSIDDNLSKATPNTVNPSNQSISTTAAQYPICPLCGEPCTDLPNSVACDICNQWLHYHCESLSQNQITSLEINDTHYECKTCIAQKTEINIEKSEAGSVDPVQATPNIVGNTNDLTPVRNTQLHVRQRNVNSSFNNRLLVASPTTRNQKNVNTNTTQTPQFDVSSQNSQSTLQLAEINHLKSIIDQKDKALKSKDKIILKCESENDHLKKQLSSNRSYSTTLEQKNRDLQHSLLIATQRIEQLETKTSNTNCSSSYQDVHQQSEISEMKIWFMEQKVRQLELDVHKNNTELMILKNNPTRIPNNVNQTTNAQTTRKRRRRKQALPRNEPKTSQQNDLDRKLIDDLDILHFHDENAENIEPHSDVSPEKEDFLDKPSPPKMRKKNVRQSQQKSQLPTHKLFNNQEHLSSHPLIIPISTTRHLQKPNSCEQTYLPPLSPRRVL